MSKGLTLRQEKFLAAYLKSGSATKAAVEAGYAPQSARGRGYELLNHNEQIKAALAEARKEIRRQGLDEATATLEELDEAIRFAIKTENASAYAKCIEIKAKIRGLMDRNKAQDPGASPFQINIIGVGKAPESNPPKDVTPPQPAGASGFTQLETVNPPSTGNDKQPRGGFPRINIFS